MLVVVPVVVVVLVVVVLLLVVAVLLVVVTLVVVVVLVLVVLLLVAVVAVLVVVPVVVAVLVEVVLLVVVVVLPVVVLLVVVVVLERVERQAHLALAAAVGMLVGVQQVLVLVVQPPQVGLLDLVQRAALAQPVPGPHVDQRQRERRGAVVDLQTGELPRATATPLPNEILHASRGPLDRSRDVLRVADILAAIHTVVVVRGGRARGAPRARAG